MSLRSLDPMNTLPKSLPSFTLSRTHRRRHSDNTSIPGVACLVIYRHGRHISWRHLATFGVLLHRRHAMFLYDTPTRARPTTSIVLAPNGTSDM
jgi:hypothetical protein